MMGRRWEIVGAPFDFGSGHEGTGTAPEAIRAAGLTRRLEHLTSLGFEIIDHGDVAPPDPIDPEARPKGLPEMRSYAPRLGARLEDALNRDAVPIVLGGDHSLTMISIAAVAASLRQRGLDERSIGLLWVDAHPDFETPGPHGTDTLNAMPVTHILGREVGNLRASSALSGSLDPRNLAFVGLRDVLDEERDAIERMNILAYTASDVDRLGIDEVCRKAFAHVAERTDAVVLTFDIDVLDPVFAPAVDYPEVGGLSSREGAVIMERAHQLQTLALVELVELNPTKDREHQTLRLAGQLLHRLIEGPLL
jgi:arginase